MKKKFLSWGTCMCDIIVPELEKIAEPGIIEYLQRGIELRLGGHPVDVTIDLARIGVNPADIGVISTVGTDIFADLLLREISKYGFATWIQQAEGGTGKTVILGLKGKDRLCHLDPGACQKMSLSYLVDTLTEASPEFFSLRPGYTNLDLDIAKTLEGLRKGPLKNTFILLDLCAPYQKEWSYCLELLPYIDAIHGNSKEIVKVAGGGTLEQAADKVFSFGAKCVLLTKEADGAELLTKHHRIQQPSFQIEFVEPSGCGDAFCAGILLGLAKTGKTLSELHADELSEVLIQGQVLGAAAATAVGCVEDVTREKVEGLLLQQKNRLLTETSKEER